MPSFNSHEALSIYHERKLKIPFILITANVSEEFAVDVLKRGAEDYVLKDRLERLPSAIKNALEKYHLEAEKQSSLFELIKNERNYRALVENSTDAVIVLTAEGRPKYVSPSIKRVLGFTEDEVLRLNMFAALHPQDKKTALERFTYCLQHPGVSAEAHEARIKNKNGEWVWLEVTLTNMLDDPAINGIVNNFRDISERKLARLLLAKNHLFKRSILSSLDAHIAVIDQNGVLISVNKSWDDFAIANAAGSPALVSNGSNYFTVCENAVASGDKLADKVLKGLKAVLNKELDSFKLEYPCHSPTEKRWFVLNVTRMGGDDNNVVVSHQNITDRKLAEEKALLNELMFRGLIENSTDGMAILDKEGKPLYVSPSIKNVLGYSEQEGMKLDLLSLAHPDDVPILVSLLNKAIENPGLPVKGSPTRMRHKYNGWRWVEGVITNMFHDPSINGIVYNFRDITDRINHEQAIKESEEKYRSFFKNSLDGILLTITDGQIFAANPAACQMFGMTEEEVCSAGRFGLVDNDDPRIAAAIRIRQLTGKAKTELTFIRKDGSRFPGELTSAVSKDVEGNKRTSMIIRDISERKLAEAKILHANRLYAFISQINQTILHVKSPEVLFSQACKIAIDYGKFVLAWIGMPDPEKPVIRLTASDGARPYQLAFFKEYEYEIGGPIDKVLKGANYEVAANIERESRLGKLAHKSGIKSLIVLPIKKGDAVIATFNIYATEPDFFDEQEINLLTEATADISFALGIFEKERLRKSAEESLKASQLKLLEAQAIAKIGSWETDLNTLEVIWSPETYRIFEIEPNTTVSHQKFLSFIHPEDREMVDSAFKKSAHSHIPHFVEHRIITPLGNEKHVVENWQTVFDQDGVPIRSIGTTQDVTERKQAQEKLRKTELQYKQIVETAQEGIWLIDENDKTTFGNEKLCQILEYNKSEIIGKNLFEFMGDEKNQISLKAIAERQAETSGHSDVKLISKSGKEVWTSISVDPFYDAQGNYNGSLAMVADITEKKALQELLDKSAKLAKIGSYELDLVKNELYWSPITKEIHELPEDFVPDVATAIDYYKEGSSRDAITAAVANTVKNGMPFDMELQIVTAKGNELWIRVIGEAEYRNGRCTRLYGSFQDINKLKIAEVETLKAFEEKNEIIESIDEAFIALDRNWIVTHWNKKADRVLGKSRETVLYKNIWDVYPDTVDTIFWSHYHGALADNIAHHFEAYYDGLDMWVDVSAYPSARGLSIFFKDITERKKSENHLKELNQNLQKYANELLISNKGLEQFSYIISHNLRAPVANIMGLTQILNTEGNDAEMNNMLMKDLSGNVERLDDVIKDLNGILRVKSEINELKEPVFLTELLENIQSSIQNLIDKENVEIDITGIEVNDFFTLKTYMHSIFYNLISNSIKYRSPNLSPVIKIKSWAEDDKIMLTYQDNGRGIDLAKNKDQVFGLYKRFHPDIEGKGVGLFMIKTQVEVLGGTVSLQSEVDKGVEFKFQFAI